ncbi:MAG: polysaccharide deacetylase family protein [Sulfuritalea sp.]|nr:polysaccharide deacetylase family protein [Sulfuritalea sp.]
MNILKTIFFFLLEYLKVNAYFRKINKGRIKVLMYHSISDAGLYFDNSVSEADFISQMNYLYKHYSVLKISQEGQISGYDSTKVNILITFDDGFKDNFTIAAKVLARYQFSGIFFVIGECLQRGSPPAFVNSKMYKSRESQAYKTFTTNDALEMINMGMTIGSHGQTHIDYAKHSFEAARSDALISKSCIETQLGVPVELFAFPWGRFRAKHLEPCKKYYKRIFTTQHGFNKVDDTVLFRNEVANTLHLFCAASGALDFFIDLIRPRAKKLN